MKKLFLFTLLACCWAVACKKEPDFKAEDDAAIKAFLDSNFITDYIKDDKTGLYFFFSYDGEGRTPVLTSTVEVIYDGYFLDGNLFYSTNGNSEFIKLKDAIAGWRLGLPFFKRGARGLMFVPSSLAYGHKGLDTLVPPNTVLIFDIELVELHPHF